MSNVFLHPGLGSLDSVILTTSGGDTINIKSVTKEINVYESIFNNFVVSDIVVYDTPFTRLVQKGLKAGLDSISFSFCGVRADGSNEPFINVKLYVYKIEASAPVGQTLQTLIIHLTSKPFFANRSKNISRCFEGQITKTVKNLATEIGITKLEIESSDDEMKGIIPYRSPVETINMLGNRCRPTSNKNNCNYVFFETLDASKFKFVSVGKLLREQSKFGNSSDSGFIVNNPVGSTSPDVLKRMTLNHEAQHYSPTKNAMNGMYTSDVLTYDMTTKQYVDTTYSYFQKFKSQDHLSNKYILQGSEQEFKSTVCSNSCVTRYAQKSQFLFDCKEKPEGQDRVGNKDDWLLPRMSLMEQLNQLSLTFTLNGNSIIRAGDVFYFGRPIANYLGSENKERDYMYNGKYLAAEIKHTLKINTGGMDKNTGIEYNTLVRGIKDSIGNE